ncbi:MAG: hypothetical protein ACM3US_06160 [Sphingomonadaceae bacterium]
MSELGDRLTDTDFELERLGSEDKVSLRLFRDLVASFEELRRKNQELLRSNSDLQSALQRANERLATLEASLATMSELSRFAMTAAARMVDRAAETIEARGGATQEEESRGFEKARMRAIELQMEVLSLLDQARGEIQHRVHQTDRKTTEVLRRTKESIITMAQELDKAVLAASSPGATTSMPAPEASEPQVQGAVLQSQSVSPSSQEVNRNIMDEDSSYQAGQQTPVHVRSGAPEQVVGPLPSKEPAPPQMNTGTPAGVPAGSIELVIRPFHNLASLLAFFRTIRRLPGVVDTRIEHLDGESLGVVLQCTGDATPIGSLLAIPGIQLRPVSATREQVELEMVEMEALN